MQGSLLRLPLRRSPRRPSLRRQSLAEALEPLDETFASGAFNGSSRCRAATLRWISARRNRNVRSELMSADAKVAEIRRDPPAVTSVIRHTVKAGPESRRGIRMAHDESRSNTLDRIP